MNAGKWITLHVIAEGKTEVQFVRSVLAPHLVGFRIKAVPHLIRTGPEGRGGGLDYQRVQRDASRLMKSDPRGEVFLTTMLDLYALPSDFPGTVQSQCGNNPYQRVVMLEDALQQAVDSRRFIPYIQLHEFEALLFVDPGKLRATYPEPEHEKAIERLVRIATDKRNPELINDGRETAPSRRIAREIPAFERQKASVGPIVAEKIGLTTLRAKCLHFGEWLKRIEQLSLPEHRTPNTEH